MILVHFFTETSACGLMPDMPTKYVPHVYSIKNETTKIVASHGIFLKKYSDFGGGKKYYLIQSFCHIT